MKKYFILLFSISIGIVTSCQNQKATTKPQKSVENQEQIKKMPNKRAAAIKKMPQKDQENIE